MKIPHVTASMSPYHALKALRELVKMGPLFECKLCGFCTPAPGLDMMNGSFLFPHDSMVSERGKDQKFFIRCKQCPAPKV